MPVIKSAIKKMRKDRERTKHNLVIKLNLKDLIKKARRTPSPKTLQEVQKALDKAVKTKLIHANKASRLKSRLSKSTGTSSATTKKTAVKKAVKKSPVKNKKK
jgi:small subunit ribosomal protein S20